MRDLWELLTPEVLAMCHAASYSSEPRHPKDKCVMTRGALEEFIRVVEESDRSRLTTCTRALPTRNSRSSVA